jgi:pyridoxamine 5'-phosphate oxidase
MDLFDRRQEYARGRLEREDLNPCPYAQFENWMRQAESCKLEEPNAMCLASVDENGYPSTRIVLLKQFSQANGLVFFTNYESRKAKEMDATGKVAVNFLWLPLQRQINIAGTVDRISTAQSLKYFLSRPLANRLGAWTSPQSKVISSRQLLESKWQEMKRKFSDGSVPLPDFWGGYAIQPKSFEFWQGRPNRLHDRFIYRLQENSNWLIQRLAP